MSEGLLAKRAAAIRAMFSRIAPRYDLLNHLLSFGQDVRWRRRVADRAAAVGPNRVLDACTGTGDLALACAAAGEVCGCDFALPMLARARVKAKRRRRRLPLFAADVLRLPLPDGCVDLVTVGFGVRNFEDLGRGFREMQRVLRDGGRLLVLEFSEPRGYAAPVLGWWLHRVLPVVGGALSGDTSAYRYLPQSVAEFPGREEITAMLAQAGLRPCGARSLSGGLVTLYEAAKERGSTTDNGEER